MKRIFIGMVLLVAMGCARQVYVPVESVRTEYKDRVNEVLVHDSVTDTRLVYVNGDTVVDWRDRVRWREKEIHDTVFHEVRDSVTVPYPVEKRLTRWQQTKMDFGGIAFGGAAVAIALAIICIIKKHRK